MCDTSEKKECRNCNHYSEEEKKCFLYRGWKSDINYNQETGPNLRPVGITKEPSDYCDDYKQSCNSKSDK